MDPDADLIMRVLNDVFSGVQEASDTSEVPLIDPVVGIWSGIVVNNDFEMEISISIDGSCLLGNQCGEFEITNISCSGLLSWVGMDGERYEFQASEMTGSCGVGSDYLLPQADGTLKYYWKGDAGETTGTLQREP